MDWANQIKKEEKHKDKTESQLRTANPVRKPINPTEKESKSLMLFELGIIVQRHQIELKNAPKRR